MAFRIEHRLGIPAPAHAIWEVLGEIERWPEWQSLYTRVKGALRIGGRIDVVEHLPSGAGKALQPQILDWVPDDQIHWRVKSGMITRTRYFEIETLTDTAVIFSNGELFDGFMTRYTPRSEKKARRDAFEAFGQALKAEVLKRT